MYMTSTLILISKVNTRAVSCKHQRLLIHIIVLNLQKRYKSEQNDCEEYVQNIDMIGYKFTVIWLILFIDMKKLGVSNINNDINNQGC